MANVKNSQGLSLIINSSLTTTFLNYTKKASRKIHDLARVTPKGDVFL